MIRAKKQTALATLAVCILLAACAETNENVPSPSPPLVNPTVESGELPSTSTLPQPEPDSSVEPAEPLEAPTESAPPRGDVTEATEATGTPVREPETTPPATETTASRQRALIVSEAQTAETDPAAEAAVEMNTTAPTVPTTSTDAPPEEAPAAAREPAEARSMPWNSSQVETELLRLINDQRLQNGIPVLEIDDAMQFAAAIRAEEALESLSHVRPDGTPYHTAFDESGFSYAGKWHGENLAVVRLDGGDRYDDAAIAAAVFAEWRTSPGHEQNMLSANFAYTGISVFASSEESGIRIGSAQLFASE